MLDQIRKSTLRTSGTSTLRLSPALTRSGKLHLLVFVLIVCVAALVLAVLPGARAYASEPATYLALGDSITNGYQPSDQAAEGTHLTDDTFPIIIADACGYTLDNEAIDSSTAADVYALVSSGGIDTTIASASLITITMGGNDIMGALYQNVADIYNADKDVADRITASSVPRILSRSKTTDSRYVAVLAVMATALNGSSKDGVDPFIESDAFNDALEAFSTNLDRTIEYLRSVNPDAIIIVATQYNPYIWLGEPYKTLLSTPVEAGLTELNSVIADGAGDDTYTVADIHAVFAAADKSDQLCFTASTPPKFDFHPTVAGHAFIAETMMELI